MQVDAGCNCLMVFEQLDDGSVSDKDPLVLVQPMLKGITALNFGPCEGVTPPFGPPFCGRYQDDDGNWFYDTEFVPTAVRTRPGHPDKIYVSALAGVLWNEPVAVILEYTLDSQGYPLEESATELSGGPYWAITDFEFESEDNMFVLEAKPGGFAPFLGRLSMVSISTGVTKVVAESSLVHPTGIAIHQGKLYVTNSTYNPGNEGGCDGHIVVADIAEATTSSVDIRCVRRRLGRHK